VFGQGIKARLWDDCTLLDRINATGWLDMMAADHDDWMMVTTSVMFNLTAYTNDIAAGSRFEWIVDTESMPPVPFYMPMWMITFTGGVTKNMSVPFCDGVLPADECPNCMSESMSHSASSSVSPSRTGSPSQSVSFSSSSLALLLIYPVTVTTTKVRKARTCQGYIIKVQTV